MWVGFAKKSEKKCTQEWPLCKYPAYNTMLGKFWVGTQ